ncbi:MAG: bifunctional rhamnulose-1-phosphate aldolase/short-chain dehydrogenase [Phycisphaerae bacterium]|nr:bifunctional rhamnulose-1-phosphate aldolase/short-chain dehydrogenase [Phycisphaerae bacterium]
MALIENRWDECAAQGLSEPELLVYRSNLLGADHRVTNYGGGNTSAKVRAPDPLTGEPMDVLWVKGSGGDLGTITKSDFSTLYLQKLLALQTRYTGLAHEDGMVALYPHCTFDLNARAPSIDTPLHAYVNRTHVDHVHPDAVIAIAASADGEHLTREVYGEEVGWLAWLRPGFELAMRLQRFVSEHPSARGVILEGHGLMTWSDTSRQCYVNTLDVINRAIKWLESGDLPRSGFGERIVAALPQDERRAIASRLMPEIRGRLTGAPKVGHFDDSESVLEFVCSEHLERLAAIGTSCPDHFLRTKIRPLVLAFEPGRESTSDVTERLPQALDSYRAEYAAYYARCKRAASPSMRDVDPIVYLVPGVGMITFAAEKSTSRIAAEFYVNAINVMRDASRASTYRGLPEQEAFDIEYWTLEEAKLQRMPKPRQLAGRVALVTGGAGGIGLAISNRLLAEGACVILCDIDNAALESSQTALRKQFGKDAVAGVWMDVTNEDSVTSAFQQAAWLFGGLDICISNAGIASAAPIEATTMALWSRNFDILATGYFLVSRSAVQLLKAQGRGGSVVFIGSKNALAASSGASAYSAAKAAELHLARCLALECAPQGIRVNVVNPDAVLRGSRIWQGEWAEQRASQLKTTVEELESVYRERSLLKRSVFPEDVAEAVAFFASERSGKSTGNIINVDAGNAAAFTR